MTGTADTEAFEFQQIYGLDTVVIPTNKPMVRKDMGDLVYLTAQENTPPSSKTSVVASSVVSRCWSVPSPSRTPNCCPAS